MNRNIALALVLSVAAAGSAFADDITIDSTPFASTRSRAEVQAELAQFRQAGVNPWSNQYNQLAGFRSTLSRSQVAGDYIASRDQVAAFTREDSGSAYLARTHVAPVASTRVAGQPVSAQ